MNEINVEIVLKDNKFNCNSDIIPIVEYYFLNNEIKPNTLITNFNKELYPVLHDVVRSIIVEDFSENRNGYVNFSSSEVRWFYYKLDIHGPLAQVEEGDEGTTFNIATHLVLPSEELYNQWENLYYDNNIKQDLLCYAESMMYFSDKAVDPFIINCNRTILLHGPPGTGKTSLCKSLAQKLAIRLQNRFESSMLIEINSHSLFSKWFSESGKLVTNLFDKIKEIIENPRVFVCVLIDEVESLAHARKLCISGNEPSDSVRVVNALLTHIDQIKRYPNLLILTTSNITESIDIAFVDRADIKQFLGLPTAAAIYRIYSTCLEELLKKKVINPFTNITPEIEDYTNRTLRELCDKSVGLSGRTLRKIPFIAHALFVRKNGCVEIDEFLIAMDKALNREKTERSHMVDLK